MQRQREYITLQNTLLLWLFAFFLSLMASTASSQTSTSSSAPPAIPSTVTAGPTAAKIEELKKTIEDDTSLAQDLKTQVLELYERALGASQRASEVSAQTAKLRVRAASAPDRITQLRDLLNAQTPPVAEDANKALNLPRAELASLAEQRRLELSVAREVLSEHKKSHETLIAAGATLGEDIVKLQKALREADEERNTPALPDTPRALSLARETYAAARYAAHEAELENARLLSSYYELLVKLAMAEQEAAALEVSRLAAEYDSLVQALQSRRAVEARLGREEAESEKAATSSLPAAIAGLAAENAKLREELEKVTLGEAEIAKRLLVIERLSNDLDVDLKTVRERVEVVGLTPAIGRLLRRRLEALPSSRDDRQRARSRRQEIARATDRRIDLEERWRIITATQQKAEATVASIPPEEIEQFGRDWLLDEASNLLAAMRTSLEELQQTYGRYLAQLTTLDAADRQLVASVEEAAEFLSLELLWIKSLPPLALSDAMHIPAALAWLFSYEGWGQALNGVVKAVQHHAASSMLAVAALLILFLLRPMARRSLATLGEKTKRIRTDEFMHTVKALTDTIIIASGWPLVLALFGWHLHTIPTDTPFSTALGLGWGFTDASAGTPFSEVLGAALLEASMLLMLFSVLRLITHPDGLARRHFRWPEELCIALRHELLWITPVWIVTSFIVNLTNGGMQEHLLALGRPSLFILGLALGVIFWRFFGGKGPLMIGLRAQHPERAVTKWWRIWYPLLLAVPLSLVLAAVLGYYFTAMHLGQLFIETLWLVLGLMLLRDFLQRWFYVTERRMRFEAALEQRREARAARESAEASGESDEGNQSIIEVEEPEIDYRELGEQARTVIRVGLVFGVLLSIWSLWSDMLPAIDLLRVELPMSRTTLVDGVERQVPLTLTDVLIGLLLLVFALFAAKNLPGLLGFTVLQRLRLNPGASYAIVTLCQYLVVGAGVIYAFSAIGLQWSKLQWLVAALGVGLGFGLQEIVANFVSGIILLLERPVRVGDIVTVGNAQAEGTVARIRIRATTIITWERKELIIPNKEFITGRVLNWTLSNTENRVFIVVGVAYGSDVKRARELILEAAADTEHLLEDPKPSVTFASFGADSLNLELRCYLPSLDYRLSTITALHDAIYTKLAKADITIAFPQRDIHLDTTKPLDIRLHHSNNSGKSS